MRDVINKILNEYCAGLKLVYGNTGLSDVQLIRAKEMVLEDYSLFEISQVFHNPYIEYLIEKYDDNMAEVYKEYIEFTKTIDYTQPLINELTHYPTSPTPPTHYSDTVPLGNPGEGGRAAALTRVAGFPRAGEASATSPSCEVKI